MDASDVAGWRETLDEIEKQVMPLARERGYSRDALLLAFMLHRATGWIEAAVAIMEEQSVEDAEDDGDGWREDA